MAYNSPNESNKSTSDGSYSFYYLRLVQLLHYIYMECSNENYEYLPHLNKADLFNWLTQDYDLSINNRSIDSMKDIIDEVIDLFFAPMNESVSSSVTKDTLVPRFICQIEDVPFLLTPKEVQFLNIMLDDPRVKPFLSESTRTKLNQSISSYPFELIAFKDIPNLQNVEATKDNHDYIQTILNAIVNHTTVTIDDVLVTPCHLRYDVRANTFSIWGIDEDEELFYQPLSSLHEVFIEDDLKPIPNAYEKLQSLLDERKLSVAFDLLDRRNGLERAFHLFSNFTKETAFLGTKNLITGETTPEVRTSDQLNDEEYAHLYHMKVTYYDFDEQDVFNRLLSLGNNITVTEPSEMRNKVINHFRDLLYHLES